MATSITVRKATESDLPAILALVLTSFRQFPLFSALYTPLYEDADKAHDTVFFWWHRLFLELFNDDTDLIVAEMPAEAAAAVIQTKSPSASDGDEVEVESWRMLEWVQKKGRLSQETSSHPKSLIVGFAIWEFREGLNAKEKPKHDSFVEHSLPGSWRAAVVRFEYNLWRRFYQRKDISKVRFDAYLNAEDELAERFYQENCYYLDNLTADFRFHRQGIGAQLVKWGIERAKGNNYLPIQTEASPKGLGLYLKLGFQKIGTWRVTIPEYEEEHMEMPVLRLDIG